MKREVIDMAKKRPTKKEEFKPEVYTRFREYDKEFQKETYQRFTVRVRKDETDVLEKLNNVENKAQYIINLIRADIEKSKE